MRILLLSFYYPPDIGPGPLRAQALVEALLHVAEHSDLSDLQIDVVTTLPNRYHTLNVSASTIEQSGVVSIQRIYLPPHQSGMVDQARAFGAYARAVLRLESTNQWDIIIATSSRLMTISLGAWVAQQSGARLYLDVRDLFTDTMEDLLRKSVLRHVMPVFRLLERWAFHTADEINVVSAGFLPHIREVAPQFKPSVFTNGIDDEFIVQDFSSSATHELPLLLYAGNIGEGQGLHHILPKIACKLEGQVCFRILGDGGRKSVLQNRLNKYMVSNVEMLNPVTRDALLAHYREADVLFLHLNDHKAFHKVLPSKIFEYAATGKPILAGVAGYAAEFLLEQVPGVEVFKPCDAAAMEFALQRLLAGPRMIERTDFCTRYKRGNIMRDMASEILSLSIN
jgi:glycosyltransferase involved in cell wall biosynthesis